mgnify:CR=1 FL=1
MKTWIALIQGLVKLFGSYREYKKKKQDEKTSKELQEKYRRIAADNDAAMAEHFGLRDKASGHGAMPGDKANAERKADDK